MAPDTTMSDLAKLLPSLQNLLTGSGKTTSSETTTADPVLQQLVQLLSGQQAGAVTSGQYSKDAAIADSATSTQNIIQQMLQGQYGNVAGVAKTTGLRNSSQSQLAINDLLARAATAGSANQQSYIDKYAGITNNITQTAAQAARNTQTSSKTSQTAAAINPISAIMGLGGSALLGKVAKSSGLTDWADQQATSLGQSIGNLFSPPDTTASSDVVNLFNQAGTSGFDNYGAAIPATDMTGFIGNDFSSLVQQAGATPYIPDAWDNGTAGSASFVPSITDTPVTNAGTSSNFLTGSATGNSLAAEPLGDSSGVFSAPEVAALPVDQVAAASEAGSTYAAYSGMDEASKAAADEFGGTFSAGTTGEMGASSIPVLSVGSNLFNMAENGINQNTLGSAASSALGWIIGGPIGAAASMIGGPILSDVIGGVGDASRDFHNFVSDMFSGDGSVICTELYSTGEISKELYIQSHEVSNLTYLGYMTWAPKWVAVIRKSKFHRNWTAKVARKYLNYKAGNGFSFIGALLATVGESFCALLGMIKRRKVSHG